MSSVIGGGRGKLREKLSVKKNNHISVDLNLFALYSIVNVVIEITDRS
jgi:hypothetical protein